MCPCPALRHIFCLKSYPTNRHCFKRTIFFAGKVYTTLKLRKFNILNFFFSKKKKKKNEFGPVDLFVNEP